MIPRRLFIHLAPLLLGSFAAAGERSDEPLAWIEVVAPGSEAFALRATIPLPPGELAPGFVEAPFGIVSHARGEPVVPAQVEGVSRYPTGEWDVVQLIARVERAESAAAGDPLRFAVVRAPHERGAAHAPGTVLEKLSAAPGNLVLRCRDVYGNLYELDLLGGEVTPGFGARTTRKAGRWLNQFRTAGVMMPADEPATPQRGGPPLPHMCGVLAWFSDYAGETPLSLDLRVHNGLVAGARDPLPGEEAIGAVYWQSLELCAPKGIALVPEVADPFFGEPYDEGELRVWPLVAPYEDGELHLMPPQAQLVRRLALVPEGSEKAARDRLANRGLGFCAHSHTGWSWSNPGTSRYFPQRETLPSLDFYARRGARGKRALRIDEAERVAALLEQLRTGEPGPYPAKSPVLGWAHPWFISIEGGTGGEEISLVEGQRAVGACSAEGYSRLALVHRRNVSRQPQATWNRAGEPVGFDGWVEGAGDERAIPFDYRTNGRGVIPVFRLPCRGGPPASAQVAEVERSGRRPPYDGGDPFAPDGALPGSDAHLVAWMPHDGQHWVRFTKNAKALLWLGDDPMAEDDLLLCAELFRLYFHGARSPHGERARVTLRHMERHAAEHPNQGLPVGRDHAWGIDAFCAYYSTAGDDWRERNRTWARRVADLLLAGAMPGGVIIRSDYPPLLQNPKYEGAHAFQSQFLLLAQRSLCESIFRGVEPERTAALEELYLRTVEYLFFGPVWQRVRAPWSPDAAPVFEQGPRWAFAVARNDGYATPPFSDEEHWGPRYLPADACRGGVETAYGYATLSWAADRTRETHGLGERNRYLRRALAYGRTAPDFGQLYADLTRGTDRPATDRTGNAAGFLARLQALGKDR